MGDVIRIGTGRTPVTGEMRQQAYEFLVAEFGTQVADRATPGDLEEWFLYLHLCQQAADEVVMCGCGAEAATFTDDEPVCLSCFRAWRRRSTFRLVGVDHDPTL
jgi:hypothetical protein